MTPFVFCTTQNVQNARLITCMHPYFAHMQKNEALEMGTKQFEELEFCQLEQESSLEEKKETQSSQLLQEQAEYHCSVALRKVWGNKSFE